MQFHEILVRERKARGLSQEELASRLQVSRQAVSKWETGDAAPDLFNLMALADALDVSLDELCGRGLPAAAEVPAPANQKSTHASLPILLALLSALVLIALIRFGPWNNLSPSEAAAAESPLALLHEEFTVSGVNFSGVSDQKLNFRFSPSVSGEGFSYQISFAGSDGAVKTVDAPYSGGVCSGTAVFEDNWGGYTVTVSVTDSISTRNLAVAENLSFSHGRSSWNDLTE